MQLQELKEIWNAYDRKLDNSIRLNKAVLKEIKLDQIKSRTSRATIAPAIEIGLNAIVMLWLGSFIADHIDSIRFLIPAIALDVAAIALLITSIFEVVMLRQIDYSRPLLGIQKRLDSLRALKIQTTKWVFTCAVLIWVPLLIVGMKAFFNIDAYAVFSPAYLVASVLAGFLVIGGVVWVSRKYRHKLENSPFLQSLMDDISGKNLSAVKAHLRELRQFEEENGPV